MNNLKSLFKMSLLGLIFLNSLSSYAQALDYQKTKLSAFEILDIKCNVCHESKNPNRIFTIENMDKYKKRINKQVFVFKRMPKGRKRRKEMTESDYQRIKEWIKTSSKK